MLSPWDDYYVHQAGEPLAIVEDKDPRWFDRGYFNLHDAEGRFFLLTGIGTYPNTRVMDGYATALVKRKQHNLRVSRRLAGDRENTRVGPLSFQVVTPMNSWKLSLEPNDLHISFSLDSQKRSVPLLVKKMVYGEAHGEPSAFSHFVQFVRYRGWVEVGDDRFEGEFHGIRDRSWGVRAAKGGLGLHFWIGVQFRDFCLAVMLDENRDNSVAYFDGALLFDSGETVPIVEFGHRIEFADGPMEHTGGELFAKDASGREWHIRTWRCSRGIYMSGGGYGGWHGIDRGELHQEGECWEVDDTRVRDALPLPMYDQLARFQIGDETALGVFETGFSRSRHYTYKARGF